MADKSKIELVIEVDPAKGNAGIKTINAGLSNMEQAAVRATRSASQGMDGFTSSMVKGAAVGNLLAEGIKNALGWLKEMTVEVAKYAARTEVLTVVSQQLAKVNGIAGSQVDFLVDRIKALGITTQEAHGVVQKMIFAELDLGKAAQLARVAQNAAVIAGVDSSEALENIILGITTGQTRLLHNMGLQVSLEQTIQEEEKKVGRAITETEKRSAMLNKVLQEGVKIRGTYEAAMEKVGKQATSLKRYFDEAKNAIGDQFLGAMRKTVDGLKESAIWLKDNAAFVGDLAKGIGILVAAGTIGMLTQKLWGVVGVLQALGVAATANPIGLIAAGVAGAGAIIYSEWRKMEKPFREMDAAYDKWLTGQISGAKTGADLASATDRVEKAFAAGAIGAKQYAQALDMIDAAQARVNGWGDLSEWSKRNGLNIKIKDPKAEAAAAAALAEEVGKAQLANDKAFRDRALEASKAGLTGFAKEMADVNAEIAKRTVLVDQNGQSHQFALTKSSWNSIIQELQLKFAAFKEKFFKDNREHLADYLKGEEEAAKKRQEWDSNLYQQRLAYNVQIAQQDLDHIRDMYRVQEDVAAATRDRQLRGLEAIDARTVEQKVAVEQRKADIEIQYLQRVQEIKQKLFDMDAAQQLLETESMMATRGYQADEIAARIAKLKQDQDEIRQANAAAGNEAIQAARENASNRAAQLVRDHNLQIFESLKQQAGGVFDALLQKSQSVWSAIANSFKTAILTAIKEVVTSRVAAMLMSLFTGQKVSFAGAGGGGGVLGGLGGLLGIGAVPVFAGTSGGWAPGAVTPPGAMAALGGGMTQQQAAQIVLAAAGATGGNTGAAGGTSKTGMLAGLKGSFSGWKDMLTNLGNLGFKPERWRMDEMGNMTKLSGAKGVGGLKGGAMLAGGAILAMDGLRRGGMVGLAETTAGGALIGAKFGGGLGAAIGAGIGAIAGVVRLFVKGAEEKAKEKIKALYGVDIRDKALIKQIVETAKQAYGGNLDMAIRSAQIRDLIQLYAMTTGQRPTGMPASVTPVTLGESGGSLFQSANYQNGTALPGLGGLPSLDAIGAGTPSNAVIVNFTMPAEAVNDAFNGRTVQVIANNPRTVQGATMKAARSNVGRRELTALQLSPGLVTA